MNPRDWGAYYSRGLSKSDSGDHKGALVDLNVAIQLNPSSSISRIAKGMTKEKLGDQKGACRDAKEGYQMGYREGWVADWIKNNC